MFKSSFAASCAETSRNAWCNKISILTLLYAVVNYLMLICNIILGSPCFWINLTVICTTGPHRSLISCSVIICIQPVPKAYRKWCVEFRPTPWWSPSVRTGFPAVIQHSLSEHLKCLKSKTWNDLTSANLFFLERRMRYAAKRVEQSLGYGYLSKMEWFSLRPQHV